MTKIHPVQLLCKKVSDTLPKKSHTLIVRYMLSLYNVTIFISSQSCMDFFYFFFCQDFVLVIGKSDHSVNSSPHIPKVPMEVKVYTRSRGCSLNHSFTTYAQWIHWLKNLLFQYAHIASWPHYWAHDNNMLLNLDFHFSGQLLTFC